MAKPFALAGILLGVVLLFAALAWFVWRGQDQAAETARAEETAKANAAAVAEAQRIKAAADASLKAWRETRDTLARQKTETRKQVEATRHEDATYASWADRPLPDAAVRLLRRSRPVAH